MIEAIEVTKPVSVELKHPCVMGIWLGIGFIIAPVVLGIIISVILLILAFLLDMSI